MKDGITEVGKWETVSSEYLFRHPELTVRKDAVRLPDGRTAPEFYVLEYPDWVSIIAIDENGKYVMGHQFHYGIGKTCYEIAIGVIKGDEWTLLTQLSGDPSTTNNITHCFLATEVKKAKAHHLDSTEDLEAFLLSESDVRYLLEHGQIRQVLMAASPMETLFTKVQLK